MAAIQAALDHGVPGSGVSVRHFAEQIEGIVDSVGLGVGIDHHCAEMGIWGWDSAENLMGLLDFVVPDEIGQYALPIKRDIFGALVWISNGIVECLEI